jgi:hypothetical protein
MNPNCLCLFLWFQTFLHRETGPGDQLFSGSQSSCKFAGKRGGSQGAPVTGGWMWSKRIDPGFLGISHPLDI